MDLLLVVQALFGIVVFVAIAVVLSEQRTLPGWRLLVAGLGLQFLFAFAVFNLNFLQQLLGLINSGVNAVVNATESGTLFIFGYLGGDPLNVDYPFSISEPGATMILAFRILPLMLMFTVLSAILWHYRVLPIIIKGFSVVLRKSLKVNGAVGFSSAANIFIGMVESPALIRPYIAVLTRSELFVVMSCGMATIAGSVMVFYSIILQGTLDDPLGHIITASVISAPAAIMIALIMVPEKAAASSEEIELSVEYTSLMDAITKGTYDGVRLMVSVGAMLLVLVALVALLNSLFSLIPFPGDDPLTLQRLFGYAFAPITWLMGIPWAEAQIAGALMGTKTALNELLAFLSMAQLPPGSLSEKSTVIMTYALCGFANFGSLGIMIAGLSGMCPQRATEIVELAPKSLISGTLATCMTGAIAGLLS
ncbi:MAG: nucleoside:proton symporter [Proteobacteria bacterium]|jgi:concentrative nucleoside transporter, CNT family|nr:nucleoside:proton symporter [Pseudomonadota bacterium]MDA1289884.1 nucleoside:proton symporter [Pseudomonadota bacterium]